MSPPTPLRVSADSFPCIIASPPRVSAAPSACLRRPSACLRRPSACLHRCLGQSPPTLSVSTPLSRLVSADSLSVSLRLSRPVSADFLSVSLRRLGSSPLTSYLCLSACLGQSLLSDQQKQLAAEYQRTRREQHQQRLQTELQARLQQEPHSDLKVTPLIKVRATKHGEGVSESSNDVINPKTCFVKVLGNLALSPDKMPQTGSGTSGSKC